MQTYFVVQTYSVDRRRKVVADPPREVRSEAEAIRLARRMTETKFGVVAFSRSGDMSLGDWEDAKILFQFGDFAREDAEAIRSVA